MARRRLIAAVAAGAGLSAAIAAPSAIAAPAPLLPMPTHIVVLQDGVSASTVTRRMERELGFQATSRYGSALRGFAAALSAVQVERLRANPDVRYIAQDGDVVATGAGADVGAIGARKKPSAPAVQTGIQRIGATVPATGAAVAVLDTGIDLLNTDLNVDAVRGVNCIKADKAPQDDNGHGTHVAGTIGARAGDDGTTVGVAPDSRVYAAKVLDQKARGRISGLLCGIDWVNANARDLGIRVVNVSINAGAVAGDAQCGTGVDPLHDAICTSTAAGVLYVTSAGNTGSDVETTRPAAYPEVLTVTAMTDTDGVPRGLQLGQKTCDGEKDDYAASFSNKATTPTAAAHILSAPGACVASTGIGGGTVTMSGTSMAAPHVTGTAARCLVEGGACAGMSPADVIAKLRADAAEAAAEYGFFDDPLQLPAPNPPFGYLVSARTV